MLIEPYVIGNKDLMVVNLRDKDSVEVSRTVPYNNDRYR